MSVREGREHVYVCMCVLSRAAAATLGRACNLFYVCMYVRMGARDYGCEWEVDALVVQRAGFYYSGLLGAPRDPPPLSLSSGIIGRQCALSEWVDELIISIVYSLKW